MERTLALTDQNVGPEPKIGEVLREAGAMVTKDFGFIVRRSAIVVAGFAAGLALFAEVASYIGTPAKVKLDHPKSISGHVARVGEALASKYTGRPEDTDAAAIVSGAGGALTGMMYCMDGLLLAAAIRARRKSSQPAQLPAISSPGS